MMSHNLRQCLIPLCFLYREGYGLTSMLTEGTMVNQPSGRFVDVATFHGYAAREGNRDVPRSIADGLLRWLILGSTDSASFLCAMRNPLIAIWLCST